jgi:hypothetical protein
MTAPVARLSTPEIPATRRVPLFNAALQRSVSALISANNSSFVNGSQRTPYNRFGLQLIVGPPFAA